VNKCIILINWDLCSCDIDGKINFWEIDNENFNKIKTLTGTKGYMQAIIEYKDKKLISGAWGAIEFWDIWIIK
jgi:hypothetical protein